MDEYESSGRSGWEWKKQRDLHAEAPQQDGSDLAA